jgi:hypothetical protein
MYKFHENELNNIKEIYCLLNMWFNHTIDRSFGEHYLG